MNIITKRTIVLAISIAAVSAAVTPSFAQTRTHRTAHVTTQTPGPYESQPQMGYGQFPVPGYVAASPNQCWSDEGYGRFSNCDGGG